MKRFLTPIFALLFLSCCGEKESTQENTELNTPETKPTEVNAPETKPTEVNLEDMVLIPGGTYRRGASLKSGEAENYPEELPAHDVTIEPFYLDTHEVTNAQFRKFVEATNYKTQAEKGWSKIDFPNAPVESLQPGALVFISPDEQVETRRPGAEWQWWQFVNGANWRQPTGTGSNIKGKDDHPVVCVTWEDAQAYASWAGKRLPTEAEWERAARGGLESKVFVWGNKLKPDPDKWPANIFTGEFPSSDSGLDGFKGTAPVKSFTPNGYGLYDMAGNVWEHCEDLYRPDAYDEFLKTGKPPIAGVSQPMIGHFLNYGQWPDEKPHDLSILHVTKGGSFLCHYSYCMRYRPAARHYSESLAPTNHTGFRCAVSLEETN
ncbi:MAG: formylglycine-generating enzyme family protein [Akkermansiaceae bacterium]